MNLVAYMNIEELEKIAQDNGIYVPRLRGYMLMKDEEKLTQEEIKSIKDNESFYVLEDLCTSDPFWTIDSYCHEYSNRTDRVRAKYLISGEDSKYIGIRWDRIHGKKRKILKFAIKKKCRRIQSQKDMWNKYAGMDNVLYIHARIGSDYWSEERETIKKAPWFLDMVKDAYDDSYYDIYARIKGENELNG